jgi:hypothetical protein
MGIKRSKQGGGDMKYRFVIAFLLFTVAAFGLMFLASGCDDTETVCDDGRDNDGDNYIDCFDMDCACENTGGPIPNDECLCMLEEGEPVCWLDHNARTCRYTDNYRSDSFGFGGRYPVANVDVCIAGCEKFGYLKTVRTAVIVDDSSYTVANTEVSTAIELASKWLFTLSGARMELHSIDHVPSITGSKSAFIDNWYVTHSTDPPHFIVILSHDESSASFGGYAITSSVLPGFCNDFNSPVYGHGRIYGAVIDWTHRFAACGYDLEHYKETGNWVVVGTSSLADGSCRNQAGVPCVSVPTVSYQVCGNFDADLPYLEHERTFVISVFIHEIMHAFGTNGNYDHFGTAVCDTAMGGDAYKDGGTATFQHFCGMCPIVYQNFSESYAACP